jgi:hypothetical protein
MNIHKVTVNIENRSLEAFVREGVLATIETGKQVDKVKTPINKIWILSVHKDGKAAAWMQIAALRDGAASITHEGWIGDGRPELTALSNKPSTRATVELAHDVPEKSRENLERAKIGTFGCCTSYGNGCYVTCCNSCCSDPVGCPGASCCG